MSVSKSGRRPIEDTHPDLQGRTCVISIGLRKEWAKNSSYWVELFAKPLGPHKKSHLFCIARQWSFFRQASKERIEDQYVMKHDYTSFHNVADALKEVIQSRIRDRGDIIHCIHSAANWEDEALNLQTRLACESQKPLPARSEAPPLVETVAEKFRKSVEERSKKAKW